MITFIVGVLVGWLVLALLVGLVIGAAIAQAEKPAPEFATPEPDEVYVPRSWTA